MKKKTRLTVETERVFVIRGGRVGRRGVCRACREVVCLLTADEAAKIVRVSARAIYRLVEAGKIHFTETEEGLLLICFNSLCRSLHQPEAQDLTTSSNREGENHESEG